MLELTHKNFDETIQNNELVIVDFWAEWCGPCKAFAPVFEEAAKQFPSIVFAKVNTEKEMELSQEFNIRSIPTLMIIKKQVIIYSESGALPLNAFKELIEEAIKVDVAAEIKK